MYHSLSIRQNVPFVTAKIVVVAVKLCYTFFMTRFVKKVLALTLICAGFVQAVSAVEVDEPELQSTGSLGDSIEFENYGGPYAVIETAEAITGIGTALGLEVAQSLETPVTVQPGAKYSLIHAVDLSTQEKLDADILLLNENAQVDHIKNLRRIIAGYLSAAYGYDMQDAETIAVFVTLYNAVYRGQMNVFEERYKPTVIQHLDEQKVGLSTNWEDWPGNTQIVIPLSDLTSDLSVVDTSVISDENVIEALRNDTDKGVEVREELTEIKEREVVSATERAQEAQKQATAERQAGNTEAAKQASAEATAQQQMADRKTTETRTERQQIEQDKAELAAIDTTQYVTGLFGANSGNGLYRLLTLNGATGAIVKKSPVTQIHRTAVYVVSNITLDNGDGTSTTYDDLYMAVCGIDDGHSAVRLCLIDAEGLEMQLQSSEILADTTDLVQYGDFYYVIIREGEKYFVGMYDKYLALKARSTIEVKPTSPINITGGGLLITAPNGKPCMLSANDLSAIW